MKKAIVLFSGGIDSTTCLALAVEKYGNGNTIALSLEYGQKHKKELESAYKITQYYDVEHIKLDAGKIFEGSKCPLLINSGEEIPKGTYKEQLSGEEGNPVKTYVPFRNGLFLSIATSIAIAKSCESVYYGAHADDAAGSAYPDCSTTFNDSISKAIHDGSGGEITVIAPFIRKTKAEVVAEGIKLGVPYDLTWSCYEGQEIPCMRCGTCIDRAKAFKANGREDPLLKVVCENQP